jgi:hypothetical protein
MVGAGAWAAALGFAIKNSDQCKLVTCYDPIPKE